MNIDNFFQYTDKLASGSQPSIDDIIDLKNEGYEVIINISPSSTRNALRNEAEITEKTGLYYVHFPIDCSNLKILHYKTFEGILNGFNGKKMFIHCGANIKSSNLIHMYRVLVEKVDEKVSLKTLYQIQHPEDKWFDYFRLFGLNMK